MNAEAYLNNLGIVLTGAAQPAIGRLALAGEFVLGGKRGVVLRPKRSEVSERYLGLLADEGYTFVVVDAGAYPSFYAREGDGMAPVRALPVADRQQFPSRDILSAWAQLIRTAAGQGDAARLGVAQLVALIENDQVFGPSLISSTGDISVERLGGDNSAAAEPLRTAAALIAGFRVRPESADELVRLMAAVSPLLPTNRRYSGLAESLVPLARGYGLGARRILVAGGVGAELAALVGAEGTIVLPVELEILAPLLAHLLPNVEQVFADFLTTASLSPYDEVVVVPPVGLQLNGTQLGRFELSKRGGKPRGRVPAEFLFVEHALAAVAEGGLLMTVLPEGVLASSGQADFREWLLKKAQLLAVVSVPAWTCFRSSGLKSSVVLLRKLAPDDDYPILMVEVEADNLTADIAATRSRLDAFLKRAVTACG